MKIGLYKRNPASLMNCSTEQKSLLTQLCPMSSRVHMGHNGEETILLSCEFKIIWQSSYFLRKLQKYDGFSKLFLTLLSHLKWNLEILVSFTEYMTWKHLSKICLQIRPQKEFDTNLYDSYSPKWVFIDSLPTSLHHLSKCETRKSSSRCAFIHIVSWETVILFNKGFVFWIEDLFLWFWKIQRQFWSD